ncbi:MAG: (2Fe-2S)-binding protein [Pseudomonadota bacterium]
MIVCSCNVIGSSEIEEVIVDLLREDPWQLVVPLQVYGLLSKRGKCCGCFPNVSGLIVKTTQRFHAELATPEAEIVSLLGRLRRRNRIAGDSEATVRAA